MKTAGLAIHVHHNILVENCYDYKEREEAIKAAKPLNEQEIRLRLFKMLPKKAIAELPRNLIKAIADWDKANADWDKANADLDKANADLDKANADLDKANADWDKANADPDKAIADLDKAIADWDKANADLDKANADLDKAYADLDKANADWDKANQEAWHKKWCGCKEWNGKEIIFPKNKKRL